MVPFFVHLSRVAAVLADVGNSIHPHGSQAPHHYRENTHAELQAVDPPSAIRRFRDAGIRLPSGGRPECLRGEHDRQRRLGDQHGHRCGAGYDSSRRPTPRTGDQAIHGIGTYAWQALADPFVAGREYTLSVYIAGDSDAVDDTDRSWLYIYDGSSTPAVFDNDSLAAYRYNQDGTTEPTVGDGTATNTGWPRDGGQDWGLATLSYTATAAVDGNPIGIAFYGAGDVAFDDVSVMSTPEPSTIVLCGLGILGVVSVLRRRDE